MIPTSTNATSTAAPIFPPSVLSTAEAPVIASIPNVPAISSRGRHRTPTKIHNIQAFESIFEDVAFKSTFETQHDLDLELQYKMSHPIAFLAEMKGDTMYFHQAMAQDDSSDFVDAVVKEVNDHVDNTH